MNPLPVSIRNDERDASVELVVATPRAAYVLVTGIGYRDTRSADNARIATQSTAFLQCAVAVAQPLRMGRRPHSGGLGRITAF